LSVGLLELDGPGVGEALVRIECAGVCHSDLSVVDGNRPRPVPMLLGHEAVGWVEQLGPGVADVSVGDRVVMTFLPRCGQCLGCASDGIRPCIPGAQANGAGTLVGGGLRLHRNGQSVHHHLGVSAFADHAVVNTHSLVPVADDIPAEVAALMGCAVLTGGGAVINAGRIREKDTVVIVGLGGVGMAALLTALAHPGVEVIAVDPIPAKLALAVKLGATATMTPAEATAADIRARVVIEAAGHPKGLETAIALTDVGGTTITVGLPAPDARISVSPTALVAEGRSLVGSYLGSSVPRRDIPRFIDLWRTGRLPIDRLVSSRLPLSDINAAMDRLAQGTALRQIIMMEDAS
jgi:alcohol dehydrogenase